MVVIDTSVAFKWFNADEAEHAKALQILENHLQRKTITRISVGSVSPGRIELPSAR